jgi:hypothetical protein
MDSNRCKNKDKIFKLFNIQEILQMDFYLLSIIYFVRSLGLRDKITIQTDNGEEFGGKKEWEIKKNFLRKH